MKTLGQSPEGCRVRRPARISWKSPPRTSRRTTHPAPAGLRRAGKRLLEGEPAVGTDSVVVAHVLGEHHLEMATGDDEEVVEAVLTDGAHEALGKGVRPR